MSCECGYGELALNNIPCKCSKCHCDHVLAESILKLSLVLWFDDHLEFHSNLYPLTQPKWQWFGKPKHEIISNSVSFVHIPILQPETDFVLL